MGGGLMRHNRYEEEEIVSNNETDTDVFQLWDELVENDSVKATEQGFMRGYWWTELEE